MHILTLLGDGERDVSLYSSPFFFADLIFAPVPEKNP